MAGVFAMPPKVLPFNSCPYAMRVFALWFLPFLLGSIGGALPAANTVPPMFLVEHFFQNSDFGSPILSPSGRYLGVIRPMNDRQNLAVIDLQTGESTVITGLSSEDVLSFFWKGDDILVFNQSLTITNTQSPFNRLSRWYMVGRNGKNLRVVGAMFPWAAVLECSTDWCTTLSTCW